MIASVAHAYSRQVPFPCFIHAWPDVCSNHELIYVATATATSSSYMRRVHAEHHASFMPHSLDIPSDAAPSFRLLLGGKLSEGGLARKNTLCLLVAVTASDAQVDEVVLIASVCQWLVLERCQHRNIGGFR